MKKKTILVILVVIVLLAAIGSSRKSRGNLSGINAVSDTISGTYRIAEESFLKVHEKVVREHSPITIEAHNLLLDTYYHINWTSDNSGIYFYSTEQTYDSFIITVYPPSSGDYVTFYLRLNSSEAVLDSVSLKYIFYSDRDITDLFINIPTIAVFVIVVLTFTVIPIYMIWKKK